jgi:hypothetical protein
LITRVASGPPQGGQNRYETVEAMNQRL